MSERRTPLSAILTAVDSVAEPRLDHESVHGWPLGSIESLVEQGLLVPLDPFAVVDCDECQGRHDVVHVVDHQGETLVWAVCPRVGSYEVEPARLRNWRVDIDRLAGLVAEGLVLSGTPGELVRGRLWRLGRVYHAETWCDVHLARGLRRTESGPLRERLPERSICLVPRHLPRDTTGNRLFLPLGELATWEEGRLNLDGDALVSVDVPARRRPQRRRASRLAAIEAIEREMIEHVRAARDHAFDGRLRSDRPKLLPRPKRYELATRCELSEAAVSRAFKESNVLQRLWDLADDLYGLMAHSDEFVSSVSPGGRN